MEIMTWDTDVLRRIKEIRTDRGIKQHTLALALGYSAEGPYSRMEAGKLPLKLSHLPIIAETLGCNVEDIVVPDQEAVLMDVVERLTPAARKRLFVFIRGLLNENSG